MSQFDCYEKKIRLCCEYPKNPNFSGVLVNSEVHWIGGFPWVLQISRNANQLRALVIYQGSGRTWNCQLMTVFRIKSPSNNDDDDKVEGGMGIGNLGNNASVQLGGNVCDWTELKNYTRDERDRMFTIEADVKVSKASDGGEPHPGVDPSISHVWDFDFTQPHLGITDGVLLFDDGTRLHVIKGLLADCSPDLLSLFKYQLGKGDSNEEIPLTDVDPYEFMYLLHIIRPAINPKPITDWNVEFLVKLSDRFGIEIVLQKVENYLIETTGIRDAKKLLIADKYSLSKLKTSVMSTVCHDVNRLKAIKKTEEYQKFNDPLTLALFNQYMDT